MIRSVRILIEAVDTDICSLKIVYLSVKKSLSACLVECEGSHTEAVRYRISDCFYNNSVEIRVFGAPGFVLLIKTCNLNDFVNIIGFSRFYRYIFKRKRVYKRIHRRNSVLIYTKLIQLYSDISRYIFVGVIFDL